MSDSQDEKIVKEILKNILDGNDAIPQKAKMDLKAIIEVEHNPERLLQECLSYMYSYHS